MEEPRNSERYDDEWGDKGALKMHKIIPSIMSGLHNAVSIVATL
jgi:hypothetical protein